MIVNQKCSERISKRKSYQFVNIVIIVKIVISKRTILKDAIIFQKLRGGKFDDLFGYNILVKQSTCLYHRRN